VADVDGLKKVNDRHGHMAGDNLLKRLAEVFKDSVRKDDLVAAWVAMNCHLITLTDEENARRVLKPAV